MDHMGKRMGYRGKMYFMDSQRNNIFLKNSIQLKTMPQPNVLGIYSKSASNLFMPYQMQNDKSLDNFISYRAMGAEEIVETLQKVNDLVIGK